MKKKSTCTVLAALLFALLLVKFAGHLNHKNSNEAIFIEVWDTVGRNFYDKNMADLDWVGVREYYLPKARSAKNQQDLYWVSIYPMLALLESSHLTAIPPNTLRKNSLQNTLSLEMIEPHMAQCTGVYLSTGKPEISSKIVNIAPYSILYNAGVRHGWRLDTSGQLNILKGKYVYLNFTSRTGENVSLKFPVTIQRNSTRELVEDDVKRDMSRAERMRLTKHDPEAIMYMKSLGLNLQVGQYATLPFVVTVDNHSAGERANIKPASEIFEFSDRIIDGDERIFSAKLREPGGLVRYVSFKHISSNCEVKSSPQIKHLSGNILYVKFDRFTSDVPNLVEQQLKSQPRGVLIDLRNNSGGNADAMRKLLSSFLPSGLKIGIVSNSNRSEIIKTTPSSVHYHGRLAVLVGPLSASAAEVSANSLSYYRRAKLYGTDTLGEVLLSQNFAQSNGGLVQVAVADFRGPDGNRLEHRGVKVDNKFFQSLEAIRSGRDPAQERAISYLMK